jgi:2-polyprenyl-3-methyl-5-hydroxy-6-metoxy-1,4-benzoquinol methylase
VNCRFCNIELSDEFIDLFNAPAANSFLTIEQLNEPETFYPLKVVVCKNCLLVQIDEYKKSTAIFDNEYVYFSSFSTSWLAHAKKYTEAISKRFSITSSQLVIEIASNDGYLLQYFKELQIPVLGIEPTANTAEVARLKGIESITEFFGKQLANSLVLQNKQADLLIGNNVLAHVPDINDFVGGMKLILKPNGIITMEFPHVMELVENNQFDTIYHEHFSYLSLYTVQKIFAAHGLAIFDVEQISTHGGSLRIFVKHIDFEGLTITSNVKKLLALEHAKGVDRIEYYTGFRKKAEKIKVDFLSQLIDLKIQGKKVAAYGAAAKGNTLLNFCGVKADLIEFVVDANPSKQGKFLPGSHIPVVNEATIQIEKPDIIILFPWNLSSEIINQLSYVRNWGCQFLIPIPKVQLIS